MTAEPYYIGADMVETIDNLAAGGSNLTTATISYALKDTAGTTISGGTGSYTGGTNGDYTATIESTVTDLLTDGVLYFLWVTISQGSNNDKRRLPRRAQYREAS